MDERPHSSPARLLRLVRLLALAAAMAPDATDALALALCCAQRLRLDRLRDAAPARRGGQDPSGSPAR